MTIKEAKEQLRELILDRESFIVGDSDEEIYRKDIEALKKAVEVLEKQIPKKPLAGIDFIGNKFRICCECAGKKKQLQVLQLAKPAKRKSEKGRNCTEAAELSELNETPTTRCRSTTKLPIHLTTYAKKSLNITKNTEPNTAMIIIAH